MEDLQLLCKWVPYGLACNGSIKELYEVVYVICRYMCNLGSLFLFHMILQKLLSFLGPQFPHLKKEYLTQTMEFLLTWKSKDLHVLASSWPPLF